MAASASSGAGSAVTPQPFGETLVDFRFGGFWELPKQRRALETNAGAHNLKGLHELLRRLEPESLRMVMGL